MPAAHACGANRRLWVQVLCEALAFSNTGSDGPELKAVRKLLDSVEERAGAFDDAQRAHMDAWRLRIIMPVQLSSDDGFMYNRAARNVRELIERLPEVGPEEDDALRRIQVRTPRPQSVHVGTARE